MGLPMNARSFLRFAWIGVLAGGLAAACGSSGDTSNNNNTGSGMDTGVSGDDTGSYGNFDSTTGDDTGVVDSGSPDTIPPDSGGACSPGATQCSGNGVQPCGNNGQWGAAQACNSQTCVTGACAGMCAPGQAH